MPCSERGDVVGAVSVGYQAWFTCDGDNSPIGGWWHWAPDRCGDLTDQNNAVISWPDMRPYAKTYPTKQGNQGDGRPASLFSNYDESTIMTHFEMIKFAEIDTVALQRFNPCGGEGPIRDAITPLVANAAARTGRKWYCMYDVSGWRGMAAEMTNDWTTKMRRFTSGDEYARQNGKPVVCIWGFGFNDPNRFWGAEECCGVIRWFKEQGCYVIGGVPTWWRRGEGDSRADFGEVYKAFDMLSPWMIGRAGKIRDLNHMYREGNLPDALECQGRGQDYQPIVMPGDLSKGDRKHGDFYWRHWYNNSRLPGSIGIYISMFDEYNEGNQIAPTAETKANQPKNFPHRALDEDGVACTSDYYLRITKDAGRMFKRAHGCKVTPIRPTEPVPGGGCHVSAFISLRARANGKLVCAEGGGKGPLVSNRDNVGPWEKFEVEYLGDVGDGCPTPVALKACNGRYLGVEGEQVVAQSECAITWMMEDYGEAVALKSDKGYIQGTPEGVLRLCGAEAAGWWETFEVDEQ